MEFFSNFDSGNLSRAEKAQFSCCAGPSCVCVNPVAEEFNLEVRPDTDSITPASDSYRTWFYFGVRKFQPGCSVRLNIVNMRKQLRLFRSGHKPVVKVGEEGKWERLESDVNFAHKHPNMHLSWVYQFPKVPVVVYFALVQPYSYSDLQRELAELRLKYQDVVVQPVGPYVCVETVCHSVLGLDLNLVTISSFDGILEEEESKLSRLFPHEHSLRCRKFKDKKVVFVSARVHPGEVCSSFVMRGLMYFLLHPTDPRAAHLRKNFVFKLVPMLNPDGVFRGNFRGDHNGINLNRVYGSFSFEQYPTIFAVETLLAYYHHGYSVEEMPNLPLVTVTSMSRAESLLTPKTKWDIPLPHTPIKHPPKDHRHRRVTAVRRNLFGLPAPTVNHLRHTTYCPNRPASHSASDDEPVRNNVAFYFDLHGHVSKPGCFLYGNHLDPDRQAETFVFAKLMEINCPYFSLSGCVFSKENMCQKDVTDKAVSKEGAGRVALFRSLGILHCYTLECHYTGGLETNSISSSIGTASPSLSRKGEFVFDASSYMKVGKALGISVLDYIDANPLSRLPNTSTPTVAALRDWAKAAVETPTEKKHVHLMRQPRVLTKRMRHCSLTLDQPSTSKKDPIKTTPKRIRLTKADIRSPKLEFIPCAVSLGSSGLSRSMLRKSPIKTKFLTYPKVTKSKRR